LGCCDQSFIRHQAPTAIDAAITVSDADSASLTGAMISIASNFASGDVLGFTDQNGIPGSSHVANGILSLTLSGTASMADYQTALRSVTYASTSDHPSTATRP
jgi:hypothetical protein